MTANDEYKKLCNEVLLKHFNEMLKELKEKTAQSGLADKGYVVDGFLDIFYAVQDFEKDYVNKVIKED